MLGRRADLEWCDGMFHCLLSQVDVSGAFALLSSVKEDAEIELIKVSMLVNALTYQSYCSACVCVCVRVCEWIRLHYWSSLSSACSIVAMVVVYNTPVCCTNGVLLQKACQITCQVFGKYVKREIVTIVDEDKVGQSIQPVLPILLLCLLLWLPPRLCRKWSIPNLLRELSTVMCKVHSFYQLELMQTAWVVYSTLTYVCIRACVGHTQETEMYAVRAATLCENAAHPLGLWR